MTEEEIAAEMLEGGCNASKRLAADVFRPHHFEIVVTSWFDGADWQDALLPQEIRANDLSSALRMAADLPLSAWFPENYLDPEVPE